MCCQLTPSNRFIQTKACDTDLQKPMMPESNRYLNGYMVDILQNREMLVMFGLYS